MVKGRTGEKGNGSMFCWDFFMKLPIAQTGVTLDPWHHAGEGGVDPWTPDAMRNGPIRNAGNSDLSYSDSRVWLPCRCKEFELHHHHRHHLLPQVPRQNSSVATSSSRWYGATSHSLVP